MSGRRATSRAVLAVAVLAGPGTPGSAPAQDEGPVVVTQDADLVPLRLENIRVALELLGIYQEDERTLVNGTKTVNRDTLLRGILEIRSEGFIGHPNLVELDLLGRFQLEDRDIDNESNVARVRNPEDIYEFDGSALILRESTTPLELYARRTETMIDREFGETLDATTEQYGAILRVRSDFAPSTFQYYHRIQDQTGNIGQDFHVVQDTFEMFTQLNLEDAQRFTWTYSYDNVDESGNLRLPNSFERHDGLAVHILPFGETLRSNLRSSVTLYSQTGLFPVDRVRVDERLRIRPTQRMEYRADYTFETQNRPIADQELMQGGAGFRHRLFDSLTTDFFAGASQLRQTDSGFESTLYSGDLSFDYEKLVPGGVLSATILGSLSRQEDTDSSAPIPVSDQSETFDPSLTVTLNRRNVIDQSVIVTDATGFIIYTEGIDYTVESFGDRTEIRRVLGGNIAPNETVLVDYLIGPEPANTTDTGVFAISGRYSIQEGPLNGLSVYGRYGRQNQDRESDSPLLGAADDVETVVYGVEYDTGYLNLIAEWRSRDSTLSPQDTTRFEARFYEPIGRGGGLTFSTFYQEVDRPDDNIISETFTFSGRWTQRFSSRLTTNLLFQWRRDRDNRTLDTDGFETEFDVRWNYRQTSVYGTIRWRTLDTVINDTDFVTLKAGVRREF